MPAHLRYFVAMAFGRNDTDAIYAVIGRTLKPLGVTLRRVDRIEHNENIDAKIITELEAADLVIADLTYARPSVYFEAGYAQRAIPVVYTVRSDHFKERDEDLYGNLHVHFDLKMRNIIGWSSPADEKFPARLTSRIAKVIAPLIRKKELDTEHTQLVTKFDRLSLQHKRDWLIATARAHFTTLGYTIAEPGQSQDEKHQIVVERFSEELRNSALVAIKQRGRDFQFVLFHVIPGVTKKVCNAYRFSLIFHPLYKLRLLQPPSVTPKDIYEDIVVCSMQTGSLRRLRSGLPSLHVGETEGTLRHDFEYEFARPGQVVNAMRHVTFHVLDTTARLATLSAFLDDRFRRQLSLTRGKSPRVHR